MPVSSSRLLRSRFPELWERSRAVVEGEQAVKSLDQYLDGTNWTNILIPFSNSMSTSDYEMYKAEAELPGLVSMYVNIIIGGMLRKPPSLSLIPQGNTPEELQEEILYDINEHLMSRNSGLLHFINDILREELTTSRAVISLAFRADSTDSNGGKAYPILWKAEETINWQTEGDILTRVVFQYIVEEPDPDDKFEIDQIFYYEDHYLDNGVYKVDTYKDENSPTNPIAGTGATNTVYPRGGLGNIDTQELVESITPTIQGETFSYIPVWMANGDISPKSPMLTPLVDKELSLYNKLSRRNHLLYGACTYTPVIFDGSLSDPEFDAIINAGLGSWIKLNDEARIEVLETPTDALKDMDMAIQRNVDELARMGIRILSPEAVSGTSGIALEIRNSPQTAQLGLLNTRVSDNIEEILKVLIKWNYNEDYDVSFSLSEDFNPSPIGPEWIRLVTEWYEAGFIPRSLWVKIGRNNDIVPEDYDDSEGVKELQNQDIIRSIPLPREEDDPGFNIER